MSRPINTPGEIRAALRRTACKLAAKIEAEDAAIRKHEVEAAVTKTGAVIVEYRPGENMMAIKLPTPDQDVLAEQRNRSALEAAIIRVCTGQALKGMAIAIRIGRKYDSHLRCALARMLRQGVLRRKSDGRGYMANMCYMIAAILL